MSADATTAARRPNLTDQDPLDGNRRTPRPREPIYRESAHLVIDTEGKSPEQLATEILARLGLQESPFPAEMP